MDKIDVSYELPIIARRFRAYIKKNGIDFKDADESTVIDFLCNAYANIQDEDTQEIKDGFADLDSFLKGLALADNNEVFCKLCNLCVLCEEKAFRTGLQLGAYLILELQGK